MSRETGLIVADEARFRIRRPQGRALGLTALVAVILLFSAGSTLVKLSETPGVAVAFWRMLLCSFIWIGILRVTEQRWLNWADLRPALVPSIAFGLSITFFFTGVTKTTVASAEFTGALTPLLVVPLGAWLFHGVCAWKAPFAFGLISLVGLAVGAVLRSCQRRVLLDRCRLDRRRAAVPVGHLPAHQPPLAARAGRWQR